MSAYDPPSETIGVFNSFLFTSTSENITQSYADTHYLQYPTSQSATETINSLVATTLLATNDATINSLTVGKGAGAGNSLNTALGVEALGANDIAALNTAIGYRALRLNTLADSNTAVGYAALSNTTTGGFNTALGVNTLLSNVISLNNTAVGAEALNLTTGGSNTALGYQAGRAQTSGTNNTYIGALAQANANTYTNSTALGYNATITASNQVVLGTLSEKVVIPNQIQVSYSSLPTFDSTSIGYTASFTLATLGAGTGNRNTSNTSIALPVGVYMCHLYYKIDVTYPTTTRTVIRFDVASNATLINQAIIGFVYAPAVQQYNYYSFPAILKVSANPCSVFSTLTSSGGNCLIDEATLAVVRIA